MLLGKVADERQFVALAFESLEQHDDPRHEKNQHADPEDEPAQDRDNPNYADREPGNVQEDGLKRVKADKRLLVVGRNHEEDDRRNDGDIGESGCIIVCETILGDLIGHGGSFQERDWNG